MGSPGADGNAFGSHHQAHGGIEPTENAQQIVTDLQDYYGFKNPEDLFAALFDEHFPDELPLDRENSSALRPEEREKVMDHALRQYRESGLLPDHFVSKHREVTG